MENEQFSPSITWLNMSGDVTLTWDNSTRAAMLALVTQKMSEGYSFFVLEPRCWGLLGQKKTPLTNPTQLDKATGVVVPDQQLQRFVEKLGDDDLAKAIAEGKARLSKPSNVVSLATARRAKTAEEVLSTKSVAIRPIQGG